MLDKIVVYDNERQKIGWAAANCNRTPKSEAWYVSFSFVQYTVPFELELYFSLRNFPILGEQ